MGEIITIQLNGEKKQITTPSVLDLLNELNLNLNHVIVEINQQIISKETLHKINLTNHDAVEIIRYIGGGKK